MKYRTEDPLLTAIHNRENEKALELAKDPDIDVNIQDKNDSTPLHLAIHYYLVDVVKALLNRHDTIVFLTNRNGETPLHVTIRKVMYDLTLEILKKDNIGVNTQDICEGTPLHLILEEPLFKSEIEMVLNLIDRKETNINIQNDYGKTALHLAIKRLFHYSDNYEIVFKILSKEDVDVMLRDKKNRTPLDIAKKLYHYELTDTEEDNLDKIVEKLEALENSVGKKINKPYGVPADNKLKSFSQDSYTHYP